jgi:hypothetical protein
MTDQNRTDQDKGASRRQVLRMGGMAAGSLVAAGPLLASAGNAAAATRSVTGTGGPAGLPVAEIESIIRAKGTVSNGVLNIEIDRDDLPHVTKAGVPVKPAFEINGNLCFQQLHDGSVMFNGDLAFKAEELNPAISQLIKHGLTWQALHQHLFGLEPMVWFMHMRGRGSARQLAHALAATLAVTSTPLPQAPPAHPSTPLDVKRLSKIIGVPGTVGGSGVVGFEVPRRDPITLDGVRVSPYLNIYTSVDFQPLGGDRAVVVPDFGQLAGEVGRVATVMQAQGWQIDCLYNQETGEQPQLYFSHHFKVGNAYQLAREVRRGLDQTDVTPG